MLLTVSKRVDFSASRRLFSNEISPKENRRCFGAESAAQHGTGRNYTAYFVFTGQPDPTTGMLINISEIKERAGKIINEKYDHRFLNEDNPAFITVVPTAENIASQLLKEVAPLFGDEKVIAVHLRETNQRSATAYTDGRVDANYWFSFSAARQTRSPHLSAADNAAIFGKSTSEHGHHYDARLTFAGAAPAQAEVDSTINKFLALFDHKNLNQVDELRDLPITTESLARFILRGSSLPIARIRLHEREDFFTETFRDGQVFLGMRESFSAAHRLHVPSFSEQKNFELFGKCNNPRGHGHTYVAEATVGGDYDERSGMLFNFVQMRDALDHALLSWRDKHLDLETTEFRAQPSTGENIVRALWPKLDEALDQRLTRLRLWETRNNRFTLRRL